MSKRLSKYLRAIQASLHPYNSKKKLFAGLFFVAVFLLASLAISHMPLSVRGEISITKPSVPEFTVKLVDRSYDVPSSSSIDPYTGEKVTHPGYRVENKTIEVTIKNQPFTPYYDASSGFNISLFYNVRMKGHYAENWTELYNPEIYPTQSEAKYSVITYLSRDENTWELGGLLTDFPANAKVDFQVQALIGYTYAKHYSDDGQFIPFAPWVFIGETSGWSNTQTLTIGESQTPTSSPANSPTPSQESPQTEITTIVGVVIAVAVIGAGLGLLIYLIKRK